MDDYVDQTMLELDRFAIGQPVPRSEDPVLLRGEGHYADDVSLPGQAYAVMVRSGHAHGIIRGIGAAAARAMPGVLGVYTASDLEAAGVGTVCCDAAFALEGPFTTGNIARQSFERVLPNTLVEPTPTDHFSEEERRGRLVPDRHPDEHATCYVVQGRGLVVISSCSHCGVLNAIRTAMAVSGVDKLHAVLGGFHLGVAPPDYVEHTIAELKELAPDVVIPMHCTGRNFIASMRAEMPDRLIDWNTGSRFTFGV